MYVVINLFNYIVFMVDIMMSSNFTSIRIRIKCYSRFLFEYNYSYLLLHSVMGLLLRILIQGILILSLTQGQHYPKLDLVTKCTAHLGKRRMSKTDLVHNGVFCHYANIIIKISCC